MHCGFGGTGQESFRHNLRLGPAAALQVRIDQALARQPKLDGRMVAQFTIAGNGQVIASIKQSSTLASPQVEMCVVNAIKRWEFPAPTGGGLAIVSYPFTFSPAGN